MSALRANSIGGKILVQSIAVALLPLAILAGVVVFGLTQLGSDATQRVDESRAVLESESVLVTSQDQAVSVAREINLVLLERINDVQAWARNQQVIDGAFAAGLYSRDEGLVDLPIDELEVQFEGTKSTQQAISARGFLRSELAGNDAFGEIFFTDSNGFNAAVTSPTSDFVQSDEEWWQTAWNEGLNIDNIEFDDSAGEFSVDIAVRIDDSRTGLRLGVLKTTLDARFVDRIATDRATSTTDYTVVLADGRIISETASNDLSRLMNADIDLGAGLQAALAGQGSGGLVEGETVFGYTRTLDADFFNAEATGFEGFDWIVVSSQSAETAFAPLAGLEDLRADIQQSESNLRTIILVVLAVALLLAFVMARFMARGITGPILKLTEAASKSAERALPDAVDKINEEDADIETIRVEPVAIKTGDELEELAASFNSVQDTAVDLAAKQALSRRNTAEMFVNLGRRNQSLLKRQLRFIDDLEKNEADPDTLESLFKLDHLATRMRRNAESLLVLAGDRSPRRWAAPVPIRDSVQAALAEVEGYERVDFSRINDGEVQGNVAADVAHILAELIENALNFSPPQSQVTVMGRVESEGYTIIISDEGLGMSGDDLAAANQRLSTVLELSEVPSQYLGLFVVGRLANRHNISVGLAAASTGGLAARVVLPDELTQGATQETEETPSLGANLPHPEDHVPSEDPEIAEAEAEVFSLLAQAEEALARIEDVKKRKATSDHPAEAAPAAAAPPVVRTPASVSEAPVPSAPEVPAALAEPMAAPEAEAEPFGRRTEDKLATNPPSAPASVEVAASEPAPTEAVDVGGFSFPRRDSTGSGASPTLARRAEDRPAKNAGPDLDKYGFTRREAKAPAQGTYTGAPTAAPLAPAATEEEAMVSAEHSRNRWSRFQRGKEDAEATSSQEAAETADVHTVEPTTSHPEA